MAASVGGLSLDVRYWHKADIRLLPANVRFGGKADEERDVYVFFLASLSCRMASFVAAARLTYRRMIRST
jgi:hypothetical protein